MEYKFSEELKQTVKGKRTTVGVKLIGFDKKNADQYIVGEDLKGGYALRVFFNKETKEKYAIVNNKDGKFDAFKNKETDAGDGYLTLKVKDVKVMPNENITLSVVGMENLKKIDVLPDQIVAETSKGELISTTYEEPLNLTLPMNFFKQIEDGDVTSKAFPSQMFETLKAANIPNVSTKEFVVNDSVIKMMIVGGEESKNRRIFIAHSTEFKEVKQIYDYAQLDSAGKTVDGVRDLVFRFKTGIEKIGDSACHLGHIPQELTNEILTFVNEESKGNVEIDEPYNDPVGIAKQSKNCPELKISDKYTLVSSKQKKEGKLIDPPPQQPQKKKRKGWLKFLKYALMALVALALTAMCIVASLTPVFGLGYPFYFGGAAFLAWGAIGTSVATDMKNAAQDRFNENEKAKKANASKNKGKNEDKTNNQDKGQNKNNNQDKGKGRQTEIIAGTSGSTPYSTGANNQRDNNAPSSEGQNVVQNTDQGREQ